MQVPSFGFTLDPPVELSKTRRLGLMPINLDETDLQPRLPATGMWTSPDSVRLDPPAGAIQRRILEIWVSNPRAVELEGMSPPP